MNVDDLVPEKYYLLCGEVTMEFLSSEVLKFASRHGVNPDDVLVGIDAWDADDLYLKCLRKPTEKEKERRRADKRRAAEKAKKKAKEKELKERKEYERLKKKFDS